MRPACDLRRLLSLTAVPGDLSEFSVSCSGRPACPPGALAKAGRLLSRLSPVALRRGGSLVTLQTFSFFLLTFPVMPCASLQCKPAPCTVRAPAQLAI